MDDYKIPDDVVLPDPTKSMEITDELPVVRVSYDNVPDVPEKE